MATVIDHIRRLLQWSIKQLRLFNVYVEAHEDTAEDRRKQRLSTRLYMCLFLVSILAIIPYAALTTQTITVRVENISFNKFQQLEAMYPDSLLCSCSKISASPDTFININIQLHQVFIN